VISISPGIGLNPPLKPGLNNASPGIPHANFRAFAERTTGPPGGNRGPEQQLDSVKLGVHVRLGSVTLDLLLSFSNFAGLGILGMLLIEVFKMVRARFVDLPREIF